MSDEAKRILRIDINSSNPLLGKTTLAAVIANAIKDKFPDQHVEVLAQENDFLLRAQNLAAGAPLKLNADIVQIVDINANPPPLREGALYQTIIADINELPAEEMPSPFQYRVDRAIEDACTAQGVDAATIQTIKDIVHGDPVFQSACKVYSLNHPPQL